MLSAGTALKLLPLMVMVASIGAWVGLTDVIMGFCEAKANPAMLAAPYGVMTITSPDAPVPTTAEIVVGDTTLKEVAATPPKLTEVAPVKLFPVMVTAWPMFPLVGVNDVITGGGL